jgi:hypothetical protein
MVWIRMTNKNFDAFVRYPFGSDPAVEGEYYSGGRRGLVEIAPDGGSSD